MVGINIKLNKELYKTLRKKAIDDELTLTDAVTEAVKAYVGEAK